MSWRKVKIGELLIESKIPALKPNADKRITVRLNMLGVVKRGFENEIEGATRQFIRKAGQFIYGKQNFHKGAFGIIPIELDGYETSADIPSFDLRNDCLPEWIFYFFKLGNRYLELEKIARGVGSKRIHAEQLADILIPLPSVDEQRNFIEKIKILEKKGDYLSSELSHQLHLVKKLRQQLLQDAIQGKLVAQDPDDEPASVLLQKIKAEKEQLIKDKKFKKEKDLPPIKPEEVPFEIPGNWVWCRLGGIALFNPRNKASDETEVGFIPMPLISSKYNETPKFQIKRWINIKSGFTHFANNDVVIAKITPCFENSKAGIIKDLPSGIGAGTTELYVIRGNKSILPGYIYAFIKNSEFLKRGEKLMRGVSGQQRVPSEFVCNALIPLPPINEQHRIVQKLEQLMQTFDALATSIKQSQQQNQQLLQQVLREALTKEAVPEAVV